MRLWWRLSCLAMVAGSALCQATDPPVAPAPSALTHPARKAGAGQAVTAGDGLRQGSWVTFDQLDGLPGNVNSMLQDGEGDLWFGSEGSVTHYDGAQFTTFTADDGLPRNIGTVFSIVEDRAGHLWFATGRGGAIQYDGELFRQFTTEDGLASDRVFGMLQDREGNLWFATAGGLSRYDGTGFTTFTAEDGLAHESVLCATEDRQGALWFGTRAGASRYDGQEFVTFTTGQGLADDVVTSILEDRAGHLWFGTEGGVSRYDGKHFATFTTRDGLGSDAVSSVVEDRRGNLWFAHMSWSRGAIHGGGVGVSRYDGEWFTRFTTRDGVVDDRALCMLEDRDGHLWVGTFGGVSRYDGERIRTFTTRDGLASDKVYALLEDREGNLWIGTSGGLNQYAGGRLTSPNLSDLLARHGVRSIAQDRAGNLWFGTNAGQVCRYDGERVTTWSDQEGLVGHQVRAIVEDLQGSLWFASQGGGVTRYDGALFTTFTSRDGLGNNSVQDILEDRDGNLWFGTGQGVSRFDGGRFTTFSPQKGLEGASVFSMLEDRDGNLWFGPSHYDGTHFTLEQGLAGHLVNCIAQDREGILWFGMYGGGVSRYDGSAFQHLSRRDGLPSNVVRDILQDRQGDVWIATSGGLIRHRSSTSTPGIRLTDVVADRRYGQVSEIRLPSSQTFLAFEFQGSSLTTPLDKMAYAYRLGGFDRQWRYTHQSRVEYTGLARGDYFFEVKAVDGDLNRSPAASTVTVQVRLPYERIGWASLLVLAIALIAWQALRIVLRDRRLQTANRDLEEANRTLQSTQSQLVQAEKMATVGLLAGGVAHEINNPLQILLDGARRILRFPEDAKRHQQSAGLMEQAAQRCSSVVQNLLNYTRKSGTEAEEVDLNEVVRSTLSLLQHNLQQADIQLQVEEGDPPSLEGNFTELCTVVTNLVLNARDATLAIKQEHGRKPAVEITTSSAGEGGALLKVRDNGGGIPEDARERIFDPFFTTKEVGAGTGLGLSIVDGIVKRHGGRIEVQSEVGIGTTFLVYLSGGNWDGETERETAESDVGNPS